MPIFFFELRFASFSSLFAAAAIFCRFDITPISSTAEFSPLLRLFDISFLSFHFRQSFITSLAFTQPPS
jgi:hypothetical protein